MMTEIHPDLLTSLDAVEINSATRFTLDGAVVDLSTGGQQNRRQETVDAQVSPLVLAIEENLYSQLYIRPMKTDAMRVPDPMARRDLIGALSAANSGRGTWESGWTVQRLDDEGRVAVTKDEITFWVSQTQLRITEEDVKPGQSCRVKVGKELRFQVPGFYIAIGDGPGGEDEAQPLVRFYWHLTHAAAVPFMSTATDLLNAAEIPFRLKVLVDPQAYLRADAGVLYLRRPYFRSCAEIIAQIHQVIAPELRPEVPLFTKRLAGGLGLAEDPGGSSSFGQHRCNLVASALWKSFVRGEISRDARSETLANVFRDQGLDPTRPYLNAQSNDEYHVPLATGIESLYLQSSLDGMTTSDVVQSIPARCARAESPIESAVGIGQALCREAIWDGEGQLCNWMGRPDSNDHQLAVGITVTSSALGPHLYSGSAGIALFLAQLYQLTRDLEYRRTALGAIGRSIRQLDRPPTKEQVLPLSFFAGHLGVAYVAQKISAMLRQDDLQSQVETILTRVFAATAEPHPLDVIRGNAGAIPALLSLARAPGLERCHDLAVELGDELCRASTRDGVFSLQVQDARSGTGTDRAPLTGLSHGAAGFGLALFELYAASGRPDFLDAARRAFEYEDSRFDPDQGNWPDLRPDVPPPGFTLTWCYGAPGIALSRLRAVALDPDHAERHLATGRVAVATTLEAIEKNLLEPRRDASLCHGLSGLGEVVLIASQLLDDESYHERAQALGRALIERHSASADWPSGVPSGGPNPSFMVGLAGIGYWFLRLHEPRRVPPLLWLIPEINKLRST
jgi:hypothetical protein